MKKEKKKENIDKNKKRLKKENRIETKETKTKREMTRD